MKNNLLVAFFDIRKPSNRQMPNSVAKSWAFSTLAIKRWKKKLFK